MDAGNISFMLICSALVFLMTPGLAMFYGGLVRTHEHQSEAMPLRSHGDVATSRIAEAEDRNHT